MIQGLAADFDPQTVDCVVSDLMCTLFNPWIEEVALEVWARHVNHPAEKLKEALEHYEIEDEAAGQGSGLGLVDGRRVLMQEWMTAVLERAGKSGASPADAQEYADKLAAISSSFGQPYPGVFELIKAIRDSGRQFVILSTVSFRGALAARKVGFDRPLVNKTYFSVEMGKAKHLHGDQIYELVARDQAVDLDRILFVDDNPSYVQDALRGGIYAGVVVLHPEGWAGQELAKGQLRRAELADQGLVTIDRIAELAEILALAPLNRED